MIYKSSYLPRLVYLGSDFSFVALRYAEVDYKKKKKLNGTEHNGTPKIHFTLESQVNSRSHWLSKRGYLAWNCTCACRDIVDVSREQILLLS